MSVENVNQPPNPPKSSSNTLMWVLGILGLLGLAGVCCVGVCVFNFAALFSEAGGVLAKPGNDLVEELQQNDLVIEKIGEPIEQVSVFDGGKFNTNITNSNAEIELTIEGPLGRADADGSLRFRNDNWHASDVTVTFDDGSTITVPSE